MQIEKIKPQVKIFCLYLFEQVKLYLYIVVRNRRFWSLANLYSKFFSGKKNQPQVKIFCLYLFERVELYLNIVVRNRRLWSPANLYGKFSSGLKKNQPEV